MTVDVVVCDTSVVSDLLQGGQRCREMVVLAAAAKVVSVVTVAELRGGALRAGWGARKTSDLEATIRAYPHIGVDDETAGVWARLWADCRRAGRNVGANDLWIAATALRLEVPVASLDNDFGRIPGIRLIDMSGAEHVTP